jgi:hypothetical protein
MAPLGRFWAQALCCAGGSWWQHSTALCALQGVAGNMLELSVAPNLMLVTIPA